MALTPAIGGNHKVVDMGSDARYNMERNAAVMAKVVETLLAEVRDADQQGAYGDIHVILRVQAGEVQHKFRCFLERWHDTAALTE